MKVVINRRFGGFGLSQEALRELQKRLTPDSELTIIKVKDSDNEEAPSELFLDMGEGEVRVPFGRNDPQLIEVVEELGSRANGEYANLKIVKIPDDVDYVIEEVDGEEWVVEVHRTWG